VHEDRRRLGEAFLSALELVALVALPVGAMTLALSGPLVTTLFGAKWAEASPVLAVLSLYGVLYAFSLLFANVLVATGRTVRLLLVQLIWVAVLVPSIVVGIHLRGLEGVAWAHVLTISLISVPAYAIGVLRLTGQSAGQLLRTIWRPAAAAAVAGAGAFLTARPLGAGWLSLVAGGLVGGVLYVAVVAPIALRRLPGRSIPGVLLLRRRRLSAPEGV
jgi:PST family polysaccharide transporter